MKGLHAGIVKQKGDISAVSTLEDELGSDVKVWISTGFPELDKVFGGGWPVGRVSEVFGPEGAGKSALTHMAVKNCQAMGGLPIYVDWENALESDKMKQLGINPANIVYIKPMHIEQAWELIWKALERLATLPPEKRPKCILVVWDSIAASISKKEAGDNDGTEFANFEVAKQMSRGCRKAYLVAPQIDAHFLFVNQERTQIGGMKGFGGPPKTTPGGDAVKYAASLRVRCQRIETLKDGNRAAGYRIKTSTRKNKCAPPHQSSEWILDFTHGPSPELTVLDGLIKAKVIKTAKGPGLVKKPTGPMKKSAAPPSVDDKVFADAEAEAGKPRKSATKYAAPWTEAPFVKADWLALMKDRTFRTAAFKAYRESIASTDNLDEAEASAED